MAGGVKTPSGVFDWNSATVLCVAPDGIEGPSLSNRDPRILRRIQVSDPPRRLKEMYITGLTTTDHGVELKIKYSDILLSWWNQTTATCINALTSLDEWMFISLEDHFEPHEIEEMGRWVDGTSDRLAQMGSEYERHGRQAYHFLYDIMALWHALRNATPEEKAGLLAGANTALGLFHSRVLAEALSECRKNGLRVELEPDRNGRRPDLLVDGIFADVKTVLATGVDRKAMMRDFAARLDRDVISSARVREQVGTDGMIIVGAWSSVINSILHTAVADGILRGGGFDYRVHATVPPASKGKAILAIPDLESFSNTYVEIDRGDAVAAAEYVAGPGFGKISAQKTKKYLVRTNIRRNCAYGISSDQPEICFKIQ